ncbi:hypothetical protein P2318_10830 [Myxococcaceae bacterium GXIMD 01537]
MSVTAELLEYERLMNQPYDAPEPPSAMPGTFRLVEIKDGRRLYADGFSTSV